MLVAMMLRLMSAASYAGRLRLRDGTDERYIVQY